MFTKIRFVSLSLLAIALRAAEPVIAEGEDWSLPAWVTPVSYSGFYAMDTTPADPLIRHAGVTLTWKNVNPAEGVYDFSALEENLARAKARGGMVLFRLKASIVDALEQGTGRRERQFVPQWVLDKYHPKTFRTRAEKLYAAPWDPGMQAEFGQLVREIGRRGYLASPQFLAIYLHGVSTSFGEEMDVDGPEFTAQAKAAGLTADVLMDCWKTRMDWWAEAAGANRGKVVWVGAGRLVGLDYPRDELNAYAEGKGFGLRAGFIEHYFYPRMHPPIAGQAYVDGYVTSNWSAPLHDGRYFGDEDETNEFPNTTGATRDVVARTPYFRAAQIGLNFLWVSKETLAWAGDIPRWFTLVAAKGPAECPDAACWLREAYVRGLNGVATGQPWKNIEHFVTQRDRDGARSVAAERYAMPYVQLKDRARTEEFTARRTDVSNGQNDLAFLFDPEFRRSLRGPVDIKVHYLDNARSNWSVRVATTGGASSELGVVHGRGDGAWRTATFRSGAAFAPGALGDDVDFVVHAIDGGDVTVRIVRVVRTLPPAGK